MSSFKKGHAVANYDEYSQVADYLFDSGLLQVPIAGPPGTPCEIIRWHAGVGQQLVTFAAQRTGARPELPTPEPQSSNEVLASLHVKPMAPTVMADGTPVCRVEGSYTHFLLRPVTHRDTLRMGTSPYEEGDPTGNSYCVTPADWTTGAVPTVLSTPAAASDYARAGTNANYTILVAQDVGAILTPQTLFTPSPPQP